MHGRKNIKKNYTVCVSNGVNMDERDAVHSNLVPSLSMHVVMPLLIHTCSG